MSATSINSIFLGEVASVQSYGAFVKIPGSPNQGLVHRTQISKVNVPDVSEVLSKGDSVWCKIINTTDDGKIGLSMKVVDQGSGKDLDPNGVQMQLDEQKRKEWVPGEKRKTISLDAVFNTTCSKCGTRGHLSKDCFQAAGGKTYELLPEDNSGTVQASTCTNKDTLEDLKEKKERKKEKKEAKKKEKKAAKKQKKAAKKLKKKLKKEAKKARKQKLKKKKKSSSSEDSSDSSDSSSSSSSDSESEEASHHKEKPQKNYPAGNTHDRQPRRSRGRSRSRSRSRSPVRGQRSSRTGSEFTRERKTSSSLEDRRRTRV